MSYSQGKQSGTSSSMPVPTDTQKQYVANQAATGTGVMQNIGGLNASLPDIYNNAVGGVNNAATNLAQTGNAISQNMGQGGASAYQTGINALSNISSPEYQQAQLQAAMSPAQIQYGQNLAAQGAQFGGAGQIGSARQALAGQQLAGLTQLQQQQAAANVMNNITNQQLQAGSALTGAGVSGGQLGLQGAQAGITAANQPMALAQQYAGINQLLGSMGQANPNWTGLYGTSNTSTGKSTNAGVQI